ncbi:MAG: carbamoyl transferase [Omnitrophica bacterium]|nr:carbamoyl transferase [Candidatus Omnitrophota bacterium]
MKILGVCNAYVSGATLFIDNNVVASVNEERFSRIKNHRTFPIQSINYCLRYAGLTVSDIDYIACGAWGGISQEFLPYVVEELIDAVLNDPTAKEIINDRTRVAIEKDHQFKNELMENLLKLGFQPEQINLYDHHLSHAYTAFYPSPFEEALVFTVDRRGDFKSATISKANRKSGIKLLDSTSMYTSLGAFYGFITRYLGFTPDKHEGKVTGLAAFGEYSSCIDIVKRMISYRDGRIIANIGKNYTPFLNGKLPEIEALLAKSSREDIAAAAQKVTEEIVLSFLKKHLQSTNLRNVCLAGGVFGNVKLNQRILELKEVDNVYIFPQMGDGGNAFGGGLIKLYELGLTFNYPLRDVFLGPSFENEAITVELDRHKDDLTWDEIENYSVEKIAEDISNGKVVGIFTGRMEFGPRALGSRSIITRATDKDINTILNKRLHRTEFMPFAPVTLEEYAHTYYKGWNSNHLCSYFMTVCYECTEKAISESPAIVHVDNTARPQIINSGNCNSLYYNIVKAYNDLTGIPTLINTSFNNHEEPIACSPADAMESLLKDNVDYIVIEKFVVKRKYGNS